MKCTVPPAGWWCSRAPNHEGPCAARPTFEEAQLVIHKQRPNSFGHIHSLNPLLVVWNLKGYVAPVWGEGKYSEPEKCDIADLEATTCPGCGEDMCWCGVGR